MWTAPANSLLFTQHTVQVLLSSHTQEMLHSSRDLWTSTLVLYRIEKYILATGALWLLARGCGTV